MKSVYLVVAFLSLCCSLTVGLDNKSSTYQIDSDILALITSKQRSPTMSSRSYSPYHIATVTSCGRATTGGHVPRTRRIFYSHPLQHLKATSFSCGSAGRLVPCIAVLPRPAIDFNDILQELKKQRPKESDNTDSEDSETEYLIVC